MVVKELTLDEKISLLHGQGGFGPNAGPCESNGGAGWSNAIPRVGIPAIQMADSAYGVTRGAASGRYSTALPNNLAAASAWDPQVAFEYGALIGRELRAEGYSMSLGGGVNLPREPRNGRTFEYQGEDPLLAGTLAGNFAKGVQSEHVIGDLKHYAVNDQESGHNAVNANIDKRSMRETDLRALKSPSRSQQARSWSPLEDGSLAEALQGTSQQCRIGAALSGDVRPTGQLNMDRAAAGRPLTGGFLGWIWHGLDVSRDRDRQQCRRSA